MVVCVWYQLNMKRVTALQAFKQHISWQAPGVWDTTSINKHSSVQSGLLLSQAAQLVDDLQLDRQHDPAQHGCLAGHAQKALECTAAAGNW
jgi:hypothetical protein